MACSASRLRFFETLTANDPHASTWIKDDKKWQDGSYEARFGPSIIWKAIPALRKMDLMKAFLLRFQETYAGAFHRKTDKDLILELFTRNDKVKTPFRRGIGFEFCIIDRWYDPACVPGLMSFCVIDNEEYVMVYGNDQYIQVKPTVEEITAKHPLRGAVEKHFVERGLNHLDDSWAGTDQWERLHGQADRRITAPGDREDGGIFGDGEDHRAAIIERETLTHVARRGLQPEQKWQLPKVEGPYC